MAGISYREVKMHDLPEDSASGLHPLDHQRLADSSNQDPLDPDIRPAKTFFMDFKDAFSMKYLGWFIENSVPLLKDGVRQYGAYLKSPISNDIHLLKNGIRHHGFRRHAVALTALFIYGLVPLITYFCILKHPFKTVPMSCSQDFTTSEETVNHFRFANLFTVDRTAGNFPFWVAKLIDTAWDLLVSRGMQFLAGLFSYKVFSDVLIRAIEVSPIPYRTFNSISLSSVSASTVVSLFQDIGCYGKGHTLWRFAYMALAMTYVIALPTLFSATTGYISSTSPFTRLPNLSVFIPTEEKIYNYLGHTFSSNNTNKCLVEEDISTQLRLVNLQQGESHATLTMKLHMFTGTHPTGRFLILDHMMTKNVGWFFPNETYRDYPSYDNHNCNETVYVPVGGGNFTFAEIFPHLTGYTYQDATPYCYDGVLYNYSQVHDNTRCLPNTDKNASYRWGFSTLLSSIILILHGVWSLSMFAIWLEVQLSSKLLRAGYSLSQLRSIFAIVSAAQETTGKKLEELLSFSVKELEKKLYGKDAVVEFELFAKELPFADVEPYDGA
ncbi:uncharacterized protein K452DRAFT_346889 [Aplosporella prunicola CBS 121167]|uniref:Uncharacterized protein n=1 Tax=Aplosporella prunicola CBS 121167 TaxID=1176127 RepID=A0A6A6BHR6_9PEZI|nr:uncharacterized protein K452DRAFT_346889 [Aplosporella prunicola CBS 121167]KAF2143148.1 hypothetical protein K452DRAFT_346889 [Aplosporella prunicola CBS 121167]